MVYGPAQTLREGFDKFVIIHPDKCWDWKGCIPKNPGYGQFRSFGKMYRAHIASWMLYKGEVPKGMFICHTCDNPRCSNPDHLFLSTNEGNVRDMLQKNRSPFFGKKRDENHRTKIFSKDIPEIVQMYENGNTQKSIAKKFNVSSQIISRAILQHRKVSY